MNAFRQTRSASVVQAVVLDHLILEVVRDDVILRRLRTRLHLLYFIRDDDSSVPSARDFSHRNVPAPFQQTGLHNGVSRVRGSVVFEDDVNHLPDWFVAQIDHDPTDEIRFRTVRHSSPLSLAPRAAHPNDTPVGKLWRTDHARSRNESPVCESNNKGNDASCQI